MNGKKQIALMLSIPKEARNQLRVMAAEQNLKDPDNVTSASTIAKEIVCDFLANLESPGRKNDETIRPEN